MIHKPTERILIYKCYNRTQHKDLCDGPTTYRAERVDQVVESLLRGIFERAKFINEAALVTQQLQTSAQQYQQKLRKVKADYAKAVTLTRDYGIQVKFNISEEQYLNGMEMS